MSLEAWGDEPWGDEPWGAEDGPDIERLLGEGYRSAEDMTKAAHDVIDERLRQRSVEGFSPELDDVSVGAQLAFAAATYALAATLTDQQRADVTSPCSLDNNATLRRLWPWPHDWWEPTDRRRDLVKAGALILAEIERMDRAAALAAPHVSEER